MKDSESIPSKGISIINNVENRIMVNIIINIRYLSRNNFSGVWTIENSLYEIPK